MMHIVHLSTAQSGVGHTAAMHFAVLKNLQEPLLNVNRCVF